VNGDKADVKFDADVAVKVNIDAAKDEDELEA
jgi:hypothetical protein